MTKASPKKVTQWPANRVDLRLVSDLVPSARNARTHSPSQIKQIAASIREWGWTTAVLIDEFGEIIAGHGRVLAAQALNIDRIPTMTAIGWTEAQKRAYMIADNKLALNAGWDQDVLHVELEELAALDFDLPLIGFSDDELLKLLSQPIRELDDKGVVEDAPRRVAEGDVWRLGRHRLLCADTSSVAAIDGFLGGVVPDLVVYDPPYDVQDAWGWLYPAKSIIVFYDYKRVVQAALLAAQFKNAYEFIWDGVTSWYTPNRPLARHKAAIYASDNPKWDFDAAIYSDGKKRTEKTVSNTRGSSNYQPLSGGQVHLQTVFQAPNTQVEGNHAHAKPTPWLRALLAGSAATVILDQFAGSGATFVSAPESCSVYAVEISPVACDRIVQRWETATGLLAALETPAKGRHPKERRPSRVDQQS